MPFKTHLAQVPPFDKINAVQLMHSVCRPQESMALDKWQHIPQQPSKCVVNCNPTKVDHDKTKSKRMSVADRNENSLDNEVLAFLAKFKKHKVDPSGECKQTTLAKMQQPMPT